MMNPKKRVFAEDSGISASHLRKLAFTPRMGLRRPGTTSTSSSTSLSSSFSSASSSSHDHDTNSCVSRDASSDECFVNRFFVWAAFKRNDCPKMTPEERRECPLLRCRKRFPNHELMLRHLYKCDELAAGEYWCYECERVEQFNDARNCKRCLGHPSKRKKLMGMAKDFFKDLGARSRNGSISEYDDVESSGGDDVSLGRDGSVDLEPLPSSSGSGQRSELQANEIIEIDSHEVPLPTIFEDVEQPIVDSFGVMQPQAHGRTPSPFPNPNSLADPGLMSWTYECQQQGQPDLPMTIAPSDLDLYPEMQIADQHASPLDHANHFTHDTTQTYQKSRGLGPQSSVRSTASKSSTTSTSTTDSIAISIFSNWSSDWSRNSAMDSALTSPIDNCAPDNPFKTPCPPDFDDGFPAQTNPLDCFDIAACQTGGTDLAVELPADIPMVEPTPAAPGQSQIPAQPSQHFPSAYPCNVLPTNSSGNAALDQPEHDLWDQTPVPLLPTSAEHVTGKASTLIKTATETFHLHVEESMKRLGPIKNNDLIHQFCAMPAAAVLATGLQTLLRILDGSVVDSPVLLLCFVHLAYSFSVIIHERDAPSHVKQLFSNAITYASWLTRPDRRAYLNIVRALWKPSDLSEDDVAGLVRKSSRAAAARKKGKLSTTSTSDDPYQGPLAFVAQFFLDELEHAAVREAETPTIMTSELCVRHVNEPVRDSLQIGAIIDSLSNGLPPDHASVPSFHRALSDLKKKTGRNSGLTMRRLELELMHVGKMNLSTNAFFDDYVPRIRSHFDMIYEETALRMFSRRSYHHLGVKMIETTLGCAQATNSDHYGAPQGEFDIDGIMAGVDLNMIDFNPTKLNTSGGYIGATSAITAGSSLSVTPQTNGDSAPVTAGTSPLSKEPTPPTATTPHPTVNNHMPVAAAGPDIKTSPSTGAGDEKVKSDMVCDICGYRPEGRPQWFGGSMAKHKKLQHATEPPAVFECPYPGCNAKFTKRLDNLKQHQKKKGHFVDEESGVGSNGRPPKRKKMS